MGEGEEREEDVTTFFGVMTPGAGDVDRAIGDAGRDAEAVTSGVEEREVNSSSSFEVSSEFLQSSPSKRANDSKTLC